MLGNSCRNGEDRTTRVTTQRAVEPLECRRMLSVAPLLGSVITQSNGAHAQLDAAQVYAPHSIVRGQSVEQWTVEWWQHVMATPVFDSDGTTIINPMFDEAPSNSAQSSDGKVTFLFGSFVGGDIVRHETVPSGTPILFSVIGSFWSNNDTPDPDFSLPGHYSAEQLAGFAATQSAAVDELSATLDAVPISSPFSHREISPIFGYDLPPQYNIHQVFFGLEVSGPQFPAAADGFWFMLQPLAPGNHVLRGTGHSIDISSNFPQLGEFEVDFTYNLTVVPKGRFNQTTTTTSSLPSRSLFGEESLTASRVTDLLEPITD